MKKGGGKSYKATSSAKAAEALAARGGFTGFGALQPVAGFGFGASASSAAASGEPVLPGQLDGDIAQCLRHLSKKDATTKLKALQSLRELLPRKAPADVAAALLPWGYHFKKLMMDASKSVRAESCAAMGALAAAVGKQLAPHLKSLLPPWWLAAFDPYADVAAAAKRSLSEAFPGQKQAGALAFCRADIIDHLAECLASTPQTLGDPRKDTPEEMEERHERVVAAALSAVSALLQTLAAVAAAAEQSQRGQGGGTSASDAEQQLHQEQEQQQQEQEQQQQQKVLTEVQSRIGEILCAPGFFKRKLGSKSALVRRSAYGMVSSICGAAPQLMGGCLEAASQAVLGALGEREPGNHPAMWEMVLTFVRSQPGCWEHVSLQKMLLPRLWALLRHGCFGSAAGSLPALLPFVVALPRQLLAPAPGRVATVPDAGAAAEGEGQGKQQQEQQKGQPFITNLCESLWQGLQHCSGQPGRVATVQAYREVLGWALRNSAKQSAASEQLPAAAEGSCDTGQRAYCRQLLAGHFAPVLLPRALGGKGEDAAAAMDVVQGLLLQLTASGAAARAQSAQEGPPPLPAELDELLRAVGAAAAAALAAAGRPGPAAAADSSISRLRRLVDALQPPAGGGDGAGAGAGVGGGGAAREAAARIVKGAAAALAPALEEGRALSPAACGLLADGVRRFGALPPVNVGGDGADALPRSLLQAGLRGGKGASAGDGGAMDDGVDEDASAAIADLLVACLQAALQPEAAWSSLMEELLPGQGAPDCEARLRFAALLLRRVAAAAAAAPPQPQPPGWSCQALEQGLQRLFEGIAQGNEPPCGAGAGGALSELLGAALGGNEAGTLLVSEDCALRLLSALRGALLRTEEPATFAAAGPAAAATVGLDALHLALPPAAPEAPEPRAGTGGGGGARGLWRRERLAEAVAGLVPLVFELSWGCAGELEAAADAEADAAAAHIAELRLDGSDEEEEDSDTFADDSSSVASSSGGGGGGERDGGSDEGGEGSQSGAGAARLAAARLWGSGELLAAALEELPQCATEALVATTIEKMAGGVSGACEAAGGHRLEGSEAAGKVWAHRAASAAAGLRRYPHLRARLLEAALSAPHGWQEWCAPGGGGGGGGAGAGGACGGLMTHVAASLVLLLGPAEPLQAGTRLVGCSGGGGGSEGTPYWLLGELLCASCALAGAASPSASAAPPASGLCEAAALLTSCALAAAGAGSETGGGPQLGGLLRALWRHAGADAGEGGPVYTRALITLLRAAGSEGERRGAGHLPLLRSFCREQLLPAAAGAARLPAAALEAALNAAAPALRGAGEGAVSASGLDEMSSGVCRRAIDAGDRGDEPEQLRLLRLAVACFPVMDPAGASGAPVAGASAPAERQALMALLRHAGGGGGGGAGGGKAEYERSAAALQLRGVCFGWSDMAAAEWHAVLRDLQRHISTARQEAQRAAGRLAAAACGAAQQLLGGGGGDEVMTPATAVQLLMKLSGKGLLQHHEVHGQLLGSFHNVLANASLGPCWQPSLQLLAMVLRLQDSIQSGGRAPQLQLALGAAQSELFALLMAMGAALAVAASAGAAAAGPVLEWLDGHAEEWRLLAACLGGAGDDAAAAALGAADSRCDMVGVDAVGCLLALLQWPAAAAAAAAGSHHHHHQHPGKLHQQPRHRRSSDHAAPPAAPPPPGRGCAPLEGVAWRLALHPQALAAVTFAEAASADGAAAAGPEYDDKDPIAFLTEVGLRPEMASLIAGSQCLPQPSGGQQQQQQHHHAPWQPALLQWALLLAHLLELPARGPAARRLAQALRDVPELVPSLLNRLAAAMGLGAGRGPAAAPAAQAAAHAQLAAALSALGGAGPSVGAPWDLRRTLLAAGAPPAAPAAWRPVAAACYRAVLRSLPASARLWFGDLRDRARAAAVEAYTSRHESPQLLAAELAAIRDGAAGAGGENFTVRANAAAREVVAQLDIEDGASLDLLVKLPAATPLRPAEVECRNKVGVNDGKLRKWLLSISVFLRNQNQGVVDAIALWKANVDREFEGVEPCLICYSVLSAANGQLPRLSCRTCGVAFHPACLYKWFKSSGKSTCPHCQSAF